MANRETEEVDRSIKKTEEVERGVSKYPRADKEVGTCVNITRS